MISIFGYDINLPIWLSFLSGNIGSFLGTIITTLIVGIFSYFIIFILLNYFFRKSETEIDDVILSVSRLPFMVLVIFVALEKGMAILKTALTAVWVDRLFIFAIVLVSTWWVNRVLKEGVIYQLCIVANNSEAAWDDVLVPVIERICPPIFWIIGILIGLQAVGIDLSIVIYAVGGAAFILAFALQDILSNLFGGLVLLLDTPFQFNDVIKMEDGSIVVIKNIGLRVTKLYNIGDHSDIFMPNALLGGTSIVNITRPTTDLIASFTVGVAYTSDIPKVREILFQVINGHPDVLGDIDEKLKYIDAFEEFSVRDEKINTSKERLTLERKVNKVLQKLESELDEFAEIANTLETNGLNQDERVQLKEKFFTILNLIGLIPVQKPKKLFSDAKWELKENDDEEALIKLVRSWNSIWSFDPDLFPEDKGVLKNEWNKKLLFLENRIEKLYSCVLNPVGHERRLDAYAHKVIVWIHECFKQARVEWKDPSIKLIEFGPSSLDFDVSFFVDNIKLEHYERAERIKDELRREIKRRFHENGIEIPYPQHDVHIIDTLAVDPNGL